MGVIVLGMHRSGTSALTKVVSLLGLHVGEGDELVEATEANPAGHWEVEALSLFNEDLLIELGGKWSAPPGVSPERVAELANGEMGTRAKELIDRSFAGRPFVWKDPRLCLLMPFWRRVLDEPPIVVSSVRNPLEVAQSLERRNDLLPHYTMALWERYQRRALLDAGDLPTYVVDYARLLSDPLQVWTDLDAFVSGQGLDREAPAAAEAVELFVDASLHRQQRSDDEFRQEATVEQVALWDFMHARTGRSTTFEPDEIPPESPAIQLAFDEHNRMADFENLAVQQRVGIEDLLAQIADQLAAIEKLQRWLDDSRAETAHAWSEVRRLEGEHRELAQSKAMVLDYLEAVIAERDELRSRFDRIKRLPPVRLALALRQRLAR